jgi:protein SCO1/2
VSASPNVPFQKRFASSSSPPPPPPDAGDIWSSPPPTDPTPPPEPSSPEVEEIEKDKHFLYRLGVGLVGLTVCGISLYYGLKVAKARYMGEAGSVRVGVETRGKPSLGGPFTLVSTDGTPVSQAEFLGKWTFFYFGFTHCPEICPVELNRMTRVTNDIQRERPTTPIQPLFISCDPKRDSLAAIKEYLSIFHPNFIGLVGTPNQVNEACKSYRIYYSLPEDTADEEADYLIDHSIAIFLFDPQGRFVDFFGNRYDAKEISEKVLGYIDKYTADPNWTNY